MFKRSIFNPAEIAEINILFLFSSTTDLLNPWFYNPIFVIYLNYQPLPNHGENWLVASGKAPLTVVYCPTLYNIGQHFRNVSRS